MVKNMKNKKGFTLIELITTIGLMILVGLVIVTNMSGILSKQNDEEYENFKKKIQDSACIYVETRWSTTKRNTCKTGNNCTITLNELITAGLIEDNLKDPNTGNVIDKNKTVSVKWVNNEKTCIMNG